MHPLCKSVAAAHDQDLPLLWENVVEVPLSEHSQGVFLLVAKPVTASTGQMNAKSKLKDILTPPHQPKLH